MFLMLRDKLVKLHGLVPSQLSEAASALRIYRAGEVIDKGPVKGSAETLLHTSSGDIAGGGSSQDAPENLATDSQGPEPRDGDVSAGSNGASTGPSVTDKTGHGPPAESVSPPRLQTDSKNPHGGRPEVVLPARPASFGKSESSQPRPMRRRSSSGGRPRTGDRPGSGTPGEASTDLAADRRQTELTAEKVATDFLTSNFNARVLRVAHENRGWDLTAELPDGSTLFVEVKGFSDRSNDFVITRNELRTARKEPGYRLCIVSGTRQGHGQLSWIEDVAALLTDERLDPFQWIVLDWPSAGAQNSPWSL